MTPTRRRLMVVLLLVVAPSAGLAQTACNGQWTAGAFSTAGIGGPGAAVYASCVFDDGTGPALYVGGIFSTAGGLPAKNIARWNGSSWSALGAGVGSGAVQAMAVFDDGTGPALFVTGAFTTAGGAPASMIAKWNGSAWSALGAGLSGNSIGSLTGPGGYALAVHDDGTGPALFVGGTFVMAGTTPVSNVAKWNGASFSACGPGLSHTVRALQSFDPGGGTVLFAGGDFNAIGGGLVPAGRVAIWTGGSWLPAGSGVAQNALFNTASVLSFAVHDDGSGPALYVSGRFDVAGGIVSPGVARYVGGAWSAVVGGLPNTGAWSLASYNDGTGAVLAAATTVSSSPPYQAEVRKWNGTGWSSLTPVVTGVIYSLLSVNLGSADALVVGGTLFIPGFASGIAVWTGSWITLGSGSGGGVDGPVHALQAFDDGSGPALYAGGWFTYAGGLQAKGIARWTPAGWAPVGLGLGNGGILAFAVFDSGSGPILYAGGLILANDPVTSSPMRGIVRWTSSGWAPVGAGITPTPGATSGAVRALAVFDDGGGPALYAAGDFTIAGGVAANYIAKWDGTAWSPLGAGTSGPVNALVVHDDGTGPALYAGGEFGGAGGVSAFRIAKWNGIAWTPLAFGLNTAVYALASYDDGSGPALYAGGNFQASGGQSMTRIARWNGAAWSPVGGGMAGPSPNTDGVYALRAHDDGSGRALWAGGWFNMAGGAPASNLVRWNGAAWTPLASGANATVRALAPIDLATTISMAAGGDFTTLDGLGAEHVGSWTTPRPALAFLQAFGPGTGVTITSANLIPGHEYFDVFSHQPAPGGLGTGPYLGLFVNDVSLLLAQVLLPVGSPPFHFLTGTSSLTFGPYPAPPGLVVEAISIDFTGGVLGCVSPVRTITVQ